MPAEYEQHDGTIIIWPVRPGSWGKDQLEAKMAFTRIICEISLVEKTYVLSDKSYHDQIKLFVKEAIDKAQDANEENIILLDIDSDDSWARDVAPTFVRTDKGIMGVCWQFNAWGGEYDGLYASWDKDALVASTFCDKTSYQALDNRDFVLEGGSIHSDGEGTLLVTEACLLSKGRNPHMTKQQIEDRLKSTLSVEKILWLPRGIYNDETNEHVDNVCAFVGPAKVVLAWTDDESDPQYELSRMDYEYLKSQKDAKGRDIEIIKLPIPDHPILLTSDDVKGYEFEEGEDEREVGERMAASYVNFYFANGIALVPQFGGDNSASDARAIRILSDACKDKKVIGIDARVILLGGGNIHCITQQIPKN